VVISCIESLGLLVVKWADRLESDEDKANRKVTMDAIIENGELVFAASKAN